MTFDEGDRGGDVHGTIRGLIILGKPYSRDQLARTLSNAMAPAEFER
jgi:hypothetical protein